MSFGKCRVEVNQIETEETTAVIKRMAINQRLF